MIKKSLKLAGRCTVIVLCLFFLPVGCMMAKHYSASDNQWHNHNRHSSTQQAPEPSVGEAVIQVYAARAARWRGAFGVHTWIATKRSDDQQYTRMEVMGYRVYWGGDAVRIRTGIPDGMWFGNRPTLLREIRGGNKVDDMIDKLVHAARDYPYNKTYHVWPGPNSNTFIAHLARKVPELRLELPSTAIGKDYLPGNALFARTPSGTGVQVSANGYFGMLAGLEEGLEINFLGLTAGVDFYPLAIKLPGIGRIGFSDTRRISISDPPQLEANSPLENKGMVRVNGSPPL